MNLDALKSIASTCELCDLHKGRIKPVFDKGNPNSKIFICGMVPAKDENEVGLPFVGRAGQLLDFILNESDLSLEDVYITNLVKCFLAAGKRLEQDWIDNCAPYLANQIMLLRPKVILTLGKDATECLVGSIDSMKSVVENSYDYLGSIKILPTYHPSYLLRAGGKEHKDYPKTLNNFIKAKKLLTFN